MTLNSLENLRLHYRLPETFMSDGGSHFKNNAVADYCKEHGVNHHITPAYSPWVNGLVEGTNKLLLHVLKRMVAPELEEDSDEFRGITWENLPEQWPEFLDRAVLALNNRKLPTLRFSPKELLFGLVVNTTETPLEVATSILRAEDVDVQMAYVTQQRIDGYDKIVRHAFKRKSVFDRRVVRETKGEVIFQKGDLVQVLRSGLFNTFKTERKLAPRWSAPRRIVERNVNSYILETLDGVKLDGEFSARRLRRFGKKEETTEEEEKQIEEDIEA
jgi:hypothetical protein